MWDYIINIHPSEVLSTKTKEFRINELRRKKKKKRCFTINFFFFKMNNLHFIPNNILTNFFKELKKYKKKISIVYKLYIGIIICILLYNFKCIHAYA